MEVVRRLAGSIEIPTAWWTDCLSQPPQYWRDGKAFFTDVKGDIVPDTQENVPPSRWSNLRKHHHRWLKAQLDTFPVEWRLLDIGCGQSQFSDIFSRFAVCGVDHFPYPGANVVADFTEHLPIRDESMEVVVLSNVLEHLYKPREVLAECFRVLRPTGRLLIVVPFLIKIHQAPYDYHRYTEFALDAMVRDCGFADIRVERLGNIFDVYDIDRWARANLIRANTSGLTRVFSRALIKLQNEAERFLIGLLPNSLRNGQDTIGFPQSYAVTACRPASVR